MPAVDFWFDNQIYVGVPGKGTYIFYDRDQLSNDDKYGDIQRSIEGNKHFIEDYRKRTDELFGALFFKCQKIDEANLSLLTGNELLLLYRELVEAMTSGPIITVQLWGIEACLDDDYKIIQFIHKRLQELGKEDEFADFKEAVSLNVGETVAFSEQKDFYRVAVEIAKVEKLVSLFENLKIDEISEKFLEFGREKELFEKHIKKYEWVNTEYVSGGWTIEKWLGVFRDAILDPISPSDRLDDQMKNFENLVTKRNAVIKELNPPEDILHIMNCLTEFIAQRDWTKGYYAKALLSFSHLLDEIANRMGGKREDLFNYSYREVDEFLSHGKVISVEELENRYKNGFIFTIKSGNEELITGKERIEQVIEGENISDPFEKKDGIREFKGLGATTGKIIGKARVLESADGISDFIPGEILITYMTTMEFTPVFRKAAGVVTDEGGMSCHAAIVSREFKLPCVVGTKVATRTVKTGDIIEVDGTQGRVRIIEGGEDG